MSSKPLVFVYGTLKKGFLRHSALRNAKYIGEFKTSPNYLMYHVHPPAGYPALVESESGKEIVGEVYEINQQILTDLDQIEGVPYLYRRAEIALQDPEGLLEQPVIGYLFQQPVDDLKEIGIQWL